jgi:hypothetical protein
MDTWMLSGPTAAGTDGASTLTIGQPLSYWTRNTTTLSFESHGIYLLGVRSFWKGEKATDSRVAFSDGTEWKVPPGIKGKILSDKRCRAS